MSETELTQQLQNATRARDAAVKSGAGSKAVKPMNERIQAIEDAIKSKQRKASLGDVQKIIDDADRSMRRPRAAPSIAEQESRVAASIADAEATRRWVAADPLNQVTPESVLSGRHPWPKTREEAAKVGFSEEEIASHYGGKSSTTRPAEIPEDAMVELPDGTKSTIDRVIVSGVGADARTMYKVKGQLYRADQLKGVPRRVSAVRGGKKIEGLLARSFDTSKGRAMILRADDGSERFVFASEVT